MEDLVENARILLDWRHVSAVSMANVLLEETSWTSQPLKAVADLIVDNYGMSE